jgi:Ala-tRNA(Pro) deacylase
MTIAKRLRAHLDAEGVAYRTVEHPRTTTASNTAEAAHIPGDHLAKTVVVHVETGPVLAVVPSSHRVDLTELQDLLERRLGLASETEVGALFDDCDLGAAPPVGSAYGVPAVVDRSLSGLDRVWFEGGDHRTLVSIAGTDFDRLMREARRGAFSHAV